jgi:hypothetical protein
MPAFHHLNGQLFMPASWLRGLEVHPAEIMDRDHEVASRTYKYDRREGVQRQMTPEEALWHRKEDEAIKSGILDSVRKEGGIVNPVNMTMESGRPMIRNGFHRVSTQDDEQFVPITYSADSGRRRKGLPEHTDRWDEIRTSYVPGFDEEPDDEDY